MNIITNKRDLESWVDKINKDGIVSIDCETTSLNPVKAEIVGFSMSLENSRACYIPLNHSGLNIQMKLRL